MDETSKREPDRRRVALVETTDPYPTVVECVPLLDAGYDVVVCGGSRVDQLCPALDGLPCPFVREADIVINAVKDPATRAAVAAGVRRCAPDVTIAVVAVPPSEAVQGCVSYPDLERAARHLRRSRNPHCARGSEPTLRVFA